MHFQYDSLGPKEQCVHETINAEVVFPAQLSHLVDVRRNARLSRIIARSLLPKGSVIIATQQAGYSDHGIVALGKWIPPPRKVSLPTVSSYVTCALVAIALHRLSVLNILLQGVNCSSHLDPRPSRVLTAY